MSDYLVPEDILIEILVKLPVKSLIRGMSVCKQWRSLIRSPYFISNHLSNSSENQGLLKRYDDVGREHYTAIPKRGPFVYNSDSSDLEFPFKCEIGFFGIVGCCDGLVCLSGSQRIIIWNPAIRSHVVIPLDEIHPNFALGFGVGSNFYKVVRLVYCSELLQAAEIFCLGGTGTWQKLTGFDDVRGLVPRYMWFPILFKGFLHWIAREVIGENSERNSILRFHVGDEVFGEIMLPEELEWVTLGMWASLTMMGESLGACKYDDRDLSIGNRRCDVWMMKEYGVKESWTKLYSFDCEHFYRGFWESSEALVLIRGYELATYNPETKRIRHASGFGDVVSFYVNDYKESLVLLGGYCGDEALKPLVLLNEKSN